MKLATALALATIMLCSTASAQQDPWKPLRELMFPKRAAPVVVPPPVELPPELPPPPVIMVPEPDPEPEPIAVPLPKPRDAKSPVVPAKPKAKRPLSLAPAPRQPVSPEENDGSWLAPCWMVCGHVSGKSKAQLDADEIQWRVTARQRAYGKQCIKTMCPDVVLR